MICARDVSGQGIIVDEMKQRKPLRKISVKRMKMLQEANGKFFYSHNSTIRRKPCDATNAVEKFSQHTAPSIRGLNSAETIRKNPPVLMNSGVRRQIPCDAMNAEKKQESRSPQTFTDLSSATRSTYRLKRSAARTSSSANFGNKRKPVRKQSKKQQARLRKLASIRANWWQESITKSRPLLCGVCDEEIRFFDDLDSDHIEPGHGKSDSETNLQPAHKICNQLKGSRRNFKIVRGDRNWKLIHGLL